MKTARLLIVLLNLGLLGILAYAGVRYYFSDFFEEHRWSAFNPKDAIPKQPEKSRTGNYDRYRAIETLTEKPEVVVVPDETETEEEVPALNITVRGVVFNRDNPAKSGAHIISKVEGRDVPRYFTPQDNQLISKDMPYRLKEIKEDKPDQEYTLVFEDETGKVREARYRKE